MSSFYLALFAALPLVQAGAHVAGSVSVSIGSGSATTSPVSYPSPSQQCVRDGCARQVVDGLKYGYQGPARSSDCAALFKPVTVTPSPITKTVTRTPSPASLLTVTSSVSTATVTSSIATVSTTDQTVTSTAAAVATSVTTATTTTTTTTTLTSSSVAGGAATITVKNGKRGDSKTQVPQWACDCPDLTRFSSACACAGFQPRTVTAAAATVTVTTDAPTPTNTVYTVGQATVGVTGTTTLHFSASTTVTATSTTQTTTSTTTTQTSSTTTTILAAATGNAYCSDGTVVDGTKSGSSSVGTSLVRLRIEGKEDTVYEGLILTGPQVVTTASGGAHRCDGTNNGANPAPFANGISAIADASRACGFGYDGSFTNQFDDFFITRIGTSDSTTSGNQFWGILNNYAFTPAGGCETEVLPTDELLWAFNAFNVNYFLKVSPATMTVTAGQGYTFAITGTTGDDGSFIPVGGASFNGQLSDSNGNVQFTAPTVPGTYRYKATRSDSIRSNAVTITVTA